MSRRRLLLAALGAPLAAALLALAPATGTSSTPASVAAASDKPIDEEHACGLESAPERDLLLEVDRPIGAAGVIGDPGATAGGLDTSAPISLDVLVLLDGITVAEAQAIFDPATGAPRTFAPLNVHLHVAEYRSIGLVETEAPAVISEAKRHVGGKRPAGIDVVAVLTSKDIHLAGQTVVAGMADCVGGIAHDDRAFVVAEGRGPAALTAGPAVIGAGTVAKVTAHEIAHLLGGQHHYANCIESASADDVSQQGTVDVSPCTLMFNAADLIGPNLSSLNAAVVRGHAARWAS